MKLYDTTYINSDGIRIQNWTKETLEDLLRIIREFERNPDLELIRSGPDNLDSYQIELPDGGYYFIEPTK
jgi:hypothetical protein